MNLKKFMWNIICMSQYIQEKYSNFVTAELESDDTEIIISLFQAYWTSNNDKFNNAVNF